MGGLNPYDIYFAALGNFIAGSSIHGDNLRGTSANEVLDGCGGYDRISGGAGNDYIIGGEKSDVLTGGRGNDVFAFGADDIYNDRITDFHRGEDLIHIETPWINATWADVNIREMAGDRVLVTIDNTDFRIFVDVIGQGTLDQGDFYFG